MIVGVRPILTEATRQIRVGLPRAKLIMRLETLMHGNPEKESMSGNILREPDHMMPISLGLIGADTEPDFMHREGDKVAIPFPPEEFVRGIGGENRGNGVTEKRRGIVPHLRTNPIIIKNDVYNPSIQGEIRINYVARGYRPTEGTINQAEVVTPSPI